MRRLLKFIHSLGAAGLTGAAAAMAAILMLGPAAFSSSSHLQVLVAMARIAAWIIGPSLVLTVISGLLSIVVHPPFHDAGWVWIKAATGILVLQAGLHVLGPIQEEVRRGATASDPGSLERLFKAESATMGVLLAVAVANIALGIWRPRLLPRG